MADSPSKPLRVLHALSLHAVGGTETVFRSFLERVDRTRFENHVLVLGRR